MESLPEPFATVVIKTLDCLCADEQVEAVFLGGSLALGLATPRSDVDLVVIKCEYVEVMERYVRYVDDVQVQVIAGPPRQFDIWLEQDRPQGTVIRQLSDGHLIFDRAGLGARYQSLAQEVVEEGLAPMARPLIRSHRFRLTELLEDVADCADDPLQARWLMYAGLPWIIETTFLWHQQWMPKAKRSLAEIEELDPQLADLCREFLETTDFAMQGVIFESLVAYVLAPLGGELHEPWTRPPEPVP